MKDKLLKFVNKNKVLVIGGAVVILVLIIILVALLITTPSSQPRSGELRSDSGSSAAQDAESVSNGGDESGDKSNKSESGSEINETEVSSNENNSKGSSDKIGFQLTNGTYVVNFIDYADGGSTAVDLINTAITEYMGAWNETGLTGVIDGRTPSKTVYFPYDMISFTIDSAVGTYYDVAIALEDTRYYGMTVRDNGNATSPVKFFVVLMRAPEEAGYDTNDVITKLTRWAQNINPDSAIAQPTIYAIY